jgi:hypothetical protein
VDKVSYSDRCLVDPVEDQVVSLSSLELGSHVTGTVNSRESEVAGVGLEVATDLPLNRVDSPGLGDGPFQSCNPVLGSEGGHGTISVT